MIKKEEVKRIAQLARLGLTEKEIDQLGKDLSMILDYVEQLKEVDVSQTKPMSHSIEVSNVMRKDVREEKIKNKNEELLKAAPNTQSGYLKVHPVRNSIS